MEYKCTSEVTLNGVRIECSIRNSWHTIHCAEILDDGGHPVLLSWYSRQSAMGQDWSKFTVAIPADVPNMPYAEAISADVPDMPSAEQR